VNTLLPAFIAALACCCFSSLSSMPNCTQRKVCRCRKILRARLWPSEDGSKAWDRSVVDVNGEVLLVSQFTLYGRLNGNRLDFSQALRPQQVTTDNKQIDLSSG
jgi:D-Tyr-tRNAtyr deacylase